VLVLVIGLAIMPVQVVHLAMMVVRVDYLARVHHWDHLAMRVMRMVGLGLGLLHILFDHLGHEDYDSVVPERKSELNVG